MYKNDDISIDKIRIVLNEEFMKLGEQIGEGSYGKIYKVNYTKENKIYVAKVVEIDLEEKILLDFTKREIDIFKSLNDIPPNRNLRYNPNLSELYYRLISEEQTELAYNEHRRINLEKNYNDNLFCYQFYV